MSPRRRTRTVGNFGRVLAALVRERREQDRIERLAPATSPGAPPGAVVTPSTAAPSPSAESL